LKPSHDYGIIMALKEDVEKMCNYSDAILRIGKTEGHTEGRMEGRMEGMLSTLVGLVKDGILTLKDAARRANMSEAEFCKETGIDSTKQRDCLPFEPSNPGA